MNSFLKGLAIGVTCTAMLAWWDLYENNRRWELEAYQHYAGVYAGNVRTGKLQWMWFDDYARGYLLPKAKDEVHGTPTPLPKENWTRL